MTLLKNGKKVTQPVTLGLEGDTTTQIDSGLVAGDTVIEPTASVSTSGSTSTRTGTGTSGLSGLTGGGVTGFGGGTFTGGAGFTGTGRAAG